MSLSYFKREQHIDDFQHIIGFIEEVRDSVRVSESKESSLFSSLQVMFRDTAFGRKYLKADDAFPQVIQGYSTRQIGLSCVGQRAHPRVSMRRKIVYRFSNAHFHRCNHKKKQNSG